MPGSKSTPDIDCRHNRLVRENHISFTNKPNELIGDHLSSMETIRDNLPAVVPPGGVDLGYADAVVPWTWLGLGCHVHTNAHPSKYGSFDYTAPAK
jgi:hypothetical protein